MTAHRSTDPATVQWRAALDAFQGARRGALEAPCEHLLLRAVSTERDRAAAVHRAADLPRLRQEVAHLHGLCDAYRHRMAALRTGLAVCGAGVGVDPS